MKTAQVKMSKWDAHDRYRRLQREPRLFSNQRPDIQKRLRAEAEAARMIYWQIANGHTVINLQETFQLAGFDERGWPKLAIERADRRFTWCAARTTTMLLFGQDVNHNSDAAITVVLPGHRLNMSGGTLRADGFRDVLRAVVPTIPIEHMPKGKLERYHLLWEAEWQQVAPRDPILLQHVAGDAWRVLAQWDLTEVERLVLSGRFHP